MPKTAVPKTTVIKTTVSKTAVSKTAVSKAATKAAGKTAQQAATTDDQDATSAEAPPKRKPRVTKLATATRLR